MAATKDEVCENCNGTGLVAGNAICPECKGTPSKKERAKLDTDEGVKSDEDVAKEASDQGTSRNAARPKSEQILDNGKLRNDNPSEAPDTSAADAPRLPGQGTPVGDDGKVIDEKVDLDKDNRTTDAGAPKDGSVPASEPADVQTDEPQLPAAPANDAAKAEVQP